MDSTAEPPNANSISTSNCEKNAKKEDSMIAVPSKRTKFLQTYCRQSFALPDSIMHYIAKNPSSPEIYAKMVQTCKYFFFKNPILIIPKLCNFLGVLWKTWLYGKFQRIEMDNITSKFWITDELYVNPNNPMKRKVVSSILPKLYQCDAKTLKLQYQYLYLDEILILASKVERIYFHCTAVKNQDGSIVPFEKVFEAFSSIKNIRFDCQSDSAAITSKTFAELLKIPHFSTLVYCKLENVPQDFDLESFYTYMKKNKCTQFELRFSPSIDDAYMDRLEEIIDEILDTETHNYKPPIIDFPGLEVPKKLLMAILRGPQ